MSTVTTAQALSIYTPPFRYDEYGYIWDANNHMVADNHIEKDSDGAALRVRGWGRISYMKNPEAIQDALGELMAKALTEFWVRNNSGRAESPYLMGIQARVEGKEITDHPYVEMGMVPVMNGQLNQWLAGWNKVDVELKGEENTNVAPS